MFEDLHKELIEVTEKRAKKLSWVAGEYNRVMKALETIESSELVQEMIALSRHVPEEILLHVDYKLVTVMFSSIEGGVYFLFRGNCPPMGRRELPSRVDLLEVMSDPFGDIRKFAASFQDLSSEEIVSQVCDELEREFRSRVEEIIKYSREDF